MGCIAPWNSLAVSERIRWSEEVRILSQRPKVCARGVIGSHAGFRFQFFGVGVRVPPSAPSLPTERMFVVPSKLSLGERGAGSNPATPAI